MKKYLTILALFFFLLISISVLAGSYTPFHFFYNPSLGEKGVDALNTYNAAMVKADAHLGAEKILGDPGYEDLTTALTTIGSSNVTLTIPAGTVTVASNTTIGNNIALRVFKGGQFTVNSGVTLTINGPVDAGPYQIFAGSGAVTLGGVSTIYDVWYAAPPSTPEGVIAAPIGSRFVKTSGSAPLVYVKESGTGNTGWVASSGGSGATSFTGLNDAPHSYSDQAGKALRVKSDTTGLEFYTPLSAFTGLTDVPTSYTGQAGKALRVKSDTTGLEFYTPLSAFTSLSDVPSSYTGNIGKSLRVNSSGNGLEFYSPAISNIFSASTTPTLTELGYLSGVTSSIQNQLNAKAPSTSGTSLLKGNGSGGFSSAIAGDVNSILPSMTGNSGKFLTNDGTNSSWAAAGNVTGPGSSTDKAITRFSGTGGKTVQNSLVTVDDNGSINIPSGQNYKINNTNLSYSNVGAAAASHTHAATDITSGTLDGDRLGAPTATKRGGVKATGTPSNKFYRDDDTWATPPGATVFTGLADVPSSYGNQAGRAVRVKSDATGLEFFDLPAGVTKAYATLGDSGYTTLAQALTTIGSTSTTLAIPSSAGTISVTSNTTIPANVDLLVFKGARFDVATGVTLTINSPIKAGPYQIFSWSGTGAINISGSPTQRCYWAWWGINSEAANGSFNTYNNSPALQKAFDSCGRHQDIIVTTGVWRCTSPVTTWDDHGFNAGGVPGLIGESFETCIIHFDVGSENNGLIIGHFNDHWASQPRVKNIAFTSPANGCNDLLHFEAWQMGEVDQVDVQGGATNWAVYIGTTENCRWDWRRGWGNGYRANKLGMGNVVGTERRGIYMGPAIYENTFTPTFVNGSTFTIPTDVTGYFQARNTIFINLGSDGKFIDHIKKSSYAGGVTTVTLQHAQLTSNLTHVNAQSNGSYGMGTSQIVRIHQSFVGFGSRGLYVDQGSDFTLEHGDMENNWAGEGQTWMQGTWPWTSDRVAMYSGSITKLGQTFTLTADTYIENALLLFREVGSPHGPVTCSIYNTSGGQPTTLRLTSSDIKSAAELNGGNLFGYLFTFNTVLPAGTYWIGGEYSNGDSSNYVDIGADVTHAGLGGYPGTCYYYNGTWQSTNYSMRYAINVKPAIEFCNNNGNICIRHQHMEANNVRDLLIDNCSSVDIEKFDGGIDIARSSKVTISNSNMNTRFRVDPISTVILGNGNFFPDSISFQDFGNTHYIGYLDDWFSRLPVNLKGNNPNNYAINYGFERWQPDRPESWDLYNNTWTKCGDGQTDTTKHILPYCAKLTTTADSAASWKLPQSTLDACKGSWVIISMYIMFPKEKSLGVANTPGGYLQASASVQSWGTANWQATTVYKPGDQVQVDRGGGNWATFTCVVGGLSGSTAPDWSSTNYVYREYLQDNAVTWCDWSGQNSLNGGTIDSAWADGNWRRISVPVFVPNNAISLSGTLNIKNTGTVAYIAEPSVTMGMTPPRGTQFPPQEARDFIQIGKNRLYLGYTAAPSDGRYCQRGDIYLRGDLTASQKMGWGCVTSGVAGNDAVFKDLPSLAP